MSLDSSERGREFYKIMLEKLVRPYDIRSKRL